MQRLEVSGAVRPIYGSLGVKRLIYLAETLQSPERKDNINISALPVTVLSKFGALQTTGFETPICHYWGTHTISHSVQGIQYSI